MKAIFVDGRNIGFVSDAAFYKTVRASIHFLRTPRAICFDLQSLTDAEGAGARFVEVTDSETNRVYRASIRRIRVRGFGINRGHGEQRACLISEFNKPDDSDLDPPAPKQLGLWSGAQ